jgi:hypothetical protein
MSRLFFAFIAALIATAICAVKAREQASSTPTLPPPLIFEACMRHSDLVSIEKASGAAIYMSGYLADGRKLETWYDPKPFDAATNPDGQMFIATVVERPNGSVTKDSCTVIYGVGDVGLTIPPPQQK